MVNEIQGTGAWQFPSIEGIREGVGATKKPSSLNFGEMLSGMIQNVESANHEADQAVQSMMAGDTADIHSVMLAVNKADVSLRLALEVRNKLIEAYQEIMRMSV